MSRQSLAYFTGVLRRWRSLGKQLLLFQLGPQIGRNRVFYHADVVLDLGHRSGARDHRGNRRMRQMNCKAAAFKGTA